MSKIVDERIVAYINSLNHNDRDIVSAIEKEALAKEAIKSANLYRVRKESL